MKIIGISCFYHDSAAALVINGNIISAVQEERFTRVKHDASFPIHSIKYCLNSANLKISDIDAFVFMKNHLLNLKDYWRHIYKKFLLVLNHLNLPSHFGLKKNFFKDN